MLNGMPIQMFAMRTETSAQCELASQGIGYPAFVSQLRHPVNEMPPYAQSAMPDQQVADIFAFVSSLPKPADVKTIPLLNK